MEQIKIIELIYEFFGNYASQYLLFAVGAVAGVMEWYKKQNKAKEWFSKKYTPFIGLGLSVITAVVLMFLSGGFALLGLVVNFAGIYFGEVSISTGLIKPLRDTKTKK